MKGFTKKRPLETSQKEKLIQSGLPTALCEKLQQGMRAIPLTGQAALNTAVINDQDPALIYAQQVYVLGRPGDLLLALSTSGNAENVKNAVCTAKALGLTVIGLTGEPGGWLGTHADLSLRAPARETYRVQEYHLPIYHAICREVEEALFLE